ncbi:hypothetical protein Kpho02_28600 [Kitasatospora phosalacinea]|uniref:Uncharacterized protein n=1 Tax=Kitasatospora phosalacinea TaxID=2065 RepID=A0A9W6V0D7_9ACTN|nr:DUF6215 domain-containing protein [Kitasatospora phosalacinea]GLW70561.1 hypothetical protein Kpho02_28600 [Kitasatospora phosalacinea]
MQEYLAGVGRRIAVRFVVGVFVLVGGLIWHSAQGSDPRGDGTGSADGKPVLCRPVKEGEPAGYPAMCAALNRPDLAELVGAPGEHVVSAGVGSYTRWDVGAAQVQVGKVNAAVSESRTVPYDLMLDSARVSAREVAPVAGRPAVAYAEQLHWVTLDLGTGGSGSGPGAAPAPTRDPGTAYHLVVARNADGSGGSLEVSLWREDGGLTDGDLLPALAEKLMADLDGWNAPPLPTEPGQPTRAPRPSPSPTGFRPFSGDR